MDWFLKYFDELTVNQIYEILKERVDVFVVEQDCPYHEIDGKDKKSYHLWAGSKDQINAYIRILPPGISYKEASIGRVLVKEEYRRKGLGKELMTRGIEYIEKQMNEDKIRISAQQYLYDFYTDLGFKQVSEMYLEDGIPHIEMLYEA
ncbi:MAG: GNAT family N-acetyltransferase [Bacillota bacterium]